MKTRDDRAGVKCDRARQPRVLWQMYLASNGGTPLGWRETQWQWRVFSSGDKGPRAW